MEGDSMKEHSLGKNLWRGSRYKGVGVHTQKTEETLRYLGVVFVTVFEAVVGCDGGCETKPDGEDKFC